MHRLLSPVGTLLLLVLSAMATALAFPPWSLRPLAFVSLVPLLLAIRRGSISRAMLLAAGWCLLYAWSIASVFPASLASYYDRPIWFGVSSALLIFTVMAGVYYAAFAALDRALIWRPRAWTPLLVAAAWVGAELGRGRLFTGSAFFIGNPWGLLGYSHASGPLAQIASATGLYGITFTLVAVNAGLAGLIGSWRDADARRGAVYGLAVSLLPAVASAIYGTAVLRGAADPSQSGLRQVAIVQGNVSIDRRWRSDFHGKNLDVYLQLTREVGRTDSPSLIVWPETVMNFFIEAEPGYRDAIVNTLREVGAPLLAGGPSAAVDKQPPYYNSAFLVDPERGVIERYDKEILVPFSEYNPAVGFDWMRRRVDGVRAFAPGPPAPAPLDTPLGSVGVLICNEAMLPEIAAERVRAGAEVLVNPSNDSWIAGRAFQEHMLAVVSLRAVEQRRYLIRASTAGPSAVVDPFGRVTARTDSFAETTATGSVRPQRSATVYSRVGDAFGATCLIVAVAAGIGPARALRRRSRVSGANRDTP